jgi:hypothetical protein
MFFSSIGAPGPHEKIINVFPNKNGLHSYTKAKVRNRQQQGGRVLYKYLHVVLKVF